MKNYKTIQLDIKNRTAYIWLNRPEVKNALNTAMIEELTDAYEQLSSLENNISVIVLQGNGDVFCAGADLEWMKLSAQISFEQNYHESHLLALCLNKIYHSPKVTLAVIHGAAFGGGIGLAAVCDYMLADEKAKFSFSEVRLGLIPSTIMPYILKKTNEKTTKELMLSSKVFTGHDAFRHGLANEIFTQHNRETKVSDLLGEILKGGPQALMACKKLIHQLSVGYNNNAMIELTARKLAKIRITDEAKEGISAFFEKRKPDW